MSGLLLLGQTVPLLGNPTGGAVVAGSATIGPAGSTLTINQASNTAIINWQTFSIAGGETTKFIVPNSTSATLNRVTGGNPSAIYGTLQSNGQVFLINPSGILVGAGGRIDTAGFLGSTLDVSNDAFLKGGDMHFAGSSSAGIDNQGSINAVGGDVYLIANQVGNHGTITAAQGNVGLAAGSDVLFQQAGDQHLFVQATPSGTTRAVGVTNTGSIHAASAELKAAGGNAYALAINNTGSIAATGFKKINGQVFLTTDTGDISNSGTISAATATKQGGKISLTSTSGKVANSGTIVASATAAGGTGGPVLLKTTAGTAANTGEIDAKGGQGGAGGQVEVSGAKVVVTGKVDTTAPGGTTGMFTIDPATFTVASSGGDETGAQVGSDLGTSNVTLSASQSLIIDDAISWTSAFTLTLQTQSSGSAIAINAAITGMNGGLTIDGSTTGTIATPSSAGAINVANFTLQGETTWSQVATGDLTLASFVASHDFELQNNSTFIRAQGGDGTSGNPYQIFDVYGLQGLASPSRVPLTENWELVSDISAAGTSTWNSGAGFVPIGVYDGNSSDAASFQGTFNGQGHTIDGLTINLPNGTGVGMFGDTGNSSTVENVNLTNVNVTGGYYVGGLVGIADATKTNVSSGGTVTGTTYVGGLFGIAFGTINETFSTGIVHGNSGGSDVGGLIGYVQGGSTSNSYSTATVNAPNSSEVGGLIGVSGVPISTSYATGAVTGGNTVGGLVGSSGSTIADSYFATDGTGQSVGVGSGGTVTYLGSPASSVTGLTLAQMKMQSSFDSAWDFTNVWSTQGNTTTPILIADGTQSGGSGGSNGSGGNGGSGPTDTLSGTAYINSGTTADGANFTIDLISGGSLLGSTTTNSAGGFTFSIDASDLTSGVLLTDPSHAGDTFFQALNPGSSITGIDIWGSTLRVVADTANNTLLGQTIGSLTGNGINYSVSNSALSTASGVNMNIIANYGIDGNITTGGMFVTGGDSVLTGSQNATVTGTSVSLNGPMNRTGGLTLTSTSGDIDLSGVGIPANYSTVHGLTLNSAGSVAVTNSYLSLGGGSFTATGHGYTSTGNANDSSDGIDLFNTTILAAGGDITLTGTGGYSNPGNGVQGGLGVTIGSDGSTPALLSTTGNGNITVTGTFAQNITSQTALSAIDIFEQGSAANINTLSTVNGTITLNGTVSQGQSGAGVAAVLVGGGSQLTATGTGGSVSITGNSSGSTAVDPSGNGTADTGVHIGSTGGAATNISVATNGGITIHGTGGVIDSSSATSAATTGSADGVDIRPVTTLTAGTGSSVSITGAGGSAITSSAFTGSADGVDLGNGTGGITAINVAQGGGLTVTGTGGTINTSQATDTAGQNIPSADGVALQNNAQITATGNGFITLDGNGGTVNHGSSLVGSALGVSIGSDQNGGMTIVSTSAGNLTVTGAGGTTPGLGSGTLLHGTDGGMVTVESGSGSIALSGTGGPGYAGSGGITGDYVLSAGTSVVDNVLLQSTSGAIDLAGQGTGHSLGVSILTITGDPNLDTTVATPSIHAGGAFTATSLNGLLFDGTISSTTAPITVQETNGNLTLGTHAQLSDSGTGHDITLAAGNRSTPAAYIINNSSAGGGVIQVANGAQYFLYSSDPTLDQLGGITASPSDTFYNASFPSTPTGLSGNDALLFFVSGPGVVGYMPSSSSSSGTADDNPNGSNVVPPATVPQNSDVQTDLGSIWGGSVTSPFSFDGTGSSGQTGAGNGGLANSSGNAGSVGSGDAAQLGNGELNNVNNPAASGALNLALGPGVRSALFEALAVWGDTDVGPSVDNSTTTDSDETTLGSGDVVVIDDSKVKTIPLSQAPKSLQNALSNGVLGGMPSGGGH
jgi:filamentous hemagglutinin family protein